MGGGEESGAAVANFTPELIGTHILQGVRLTWAIEYGGTLLKSSSIGPTERILVQEGGPVKYARPYEGSLVTSEIGDYNLVGISRRPGFLRRRQIIEYDDSLGAPQIKRGDRLLLSEIPANDIDEAGEPARVEPKPITTRPIRRGCGSLFISQDTTLEDCL